MGDGKHDLIGTDDKNISDEDLSDVAGGATAIEYSLIASGTTPVAAMTDISQTIADELQSTLAQVENVIVTKAIDPKLDS